jgi:DNA-binding CsgD family transcriptional regulator/tetratricopeptide (TPR) repeat protein
VPIVSAEVVGRQAELRVIGGFLESIANGPRALMLDGQPGIGKTTLVQAGVAEAIERGYTVLSCRPSQSEARLSYSSISDLLAGVADSDLADLPTPQLEALEVVLLRAKPPSSRVDHRSVATAVLTVLRKLSSRRPVVVCIDDLHWLDRSSSHTIEYISRRISGPVGFLVSSRMGSQVSENATFRLREPEAVKRLEVGPMSLETIHRILRERTGRAYSRGALVRIHDASGGNPFFAIELVRVLGDGAGLGPHTRLPATLAELTRARVAGLDARVREVLLAASALATPTVDLLIRAMGPGATQALGQAESKDIVELTGSNIRFSHPILASGVYGLASPMQRRAMHRRLASIGLDIEERARHLALAAVAGDVETLAALDAAAENAQRRGAAAAAAELLEFGLQLGPNDPGRKMRAAAAHFDTGNPTRARGLLEDAIAQLLPSTMRAEALRLLAGVRIYDDSFRDAADLLEKALPEAAGDAALQCQIQLELSFVLFNLGRFVEGAPHTDRALAAAERAGSTGLIAHALAIISMYAFMAGDGIEKAGLERALSLEDHESWANIFIHPSLIASLLWMWSGRLDEAAAGLYDLHRRCLDKGSETDVIFIALQLATLECWRGDLPRAKAIANDAHERALQIGTQVPLYLALAAVAYAAAYAGDASDARRAANSAVDIGQRAELPVLTLVPHGLLGFVDLSEGDVEAAASRLGPMAVAAASMGMREPSVVAYAADAIEALIATDQLDEAERLTDWIEEHGRRLDRVWALATGGRCRSLLLAATGKLDAAIECCERALEEHARLPMPFERARTLLVLGQLQRRRGKRRKAEAAIAEALSSFEGLGTKLWAEKARMERSRLGTQRGDRNQLTPSEQRIAELAGGGRTNREVAAAMLISPKTVEANLVRIYRKLEIGSRAELGRCLAEGRLTRSEPTKKV